MGAFHSWLENVVGLSYSKPEDESENESENESPDESENEDCVPIPCLGM